MPCHNEGDWIYRNLHEALKVLKEMGVRFEIIVVDDGSTDNTVSEAKKVNTRFTKVIGYRENKGKGFALKYGLKHATGDLITFMDSDLDIHPWQILKLIHYMDDFNADIVIGSKRHPDSKVNYPLSRRLISFGYHLFVNALFGLKVKDTQTGLKLLSRKCAMKMVPKVVVKRWAFDLELLVLAKKYNFKIKEAPVDIKYNFTGSGIDLKALKNIFQDTLGIAYRLYILKYYDRDVKLEDIKVNGLKAFFVGMLK
jgi:glycosyltransferase involved in cell wall biosynthesis